MRGYAAAGVVFFHVYPAPLFWYWSAMDLFFTLSAYLIGAQLIHSGVTRDTVLKYFKRRVVRIWPPYFITVAAMFLLSLVAVKWRLHPGVDPDLLWRYLTFTQYVELYWTPYDQLPHWPFAVHLWSLAVEEQFYILLPLLVYALLRVGPVGRYVLLGTLVCVGLASRALGLHFYAVLHHTDAFALGLLLAMLRPRFAAAGPRLRRGLFALLALGFAGALPYLVFGYAQLGRAASEAPLGTPWHALTAASFDAFWFAMFALLIAYRGAAGTAVFRWPLGVYLGRISYVLYLVHYPVFWVAYRVAKRLLEDPGIMAVDKHWVSFACLPLVFLLAHVFYRLIDQRLQESRTASAAPVSGLAPQGTVPEKAP